MKFLNIKTFIFNLEVTNGSEFLLRPPQNHRMFALALFRWIVGLDGSEQSIFGKIKFKEVNFDNIQQGIPTDSACITSRIVISILKLTRKHWSSLVSKQLTQLPLWTNIIGT